MYIVNLTKKERIIVNKVKNYILSKESKIKKISDGKAVLYALEKLIEV